MKNKLFEKIFMYFYAISFSIFIIIMCFLLISGKNSVKENEVIGATISYDQLTYYNVYVAGELATADEINTIVMGGLDWRNPSGKPVSIEFRKVERDVICDDLVEEALLSCS